MMHDTHNDLQVGYLVFEVSRLIRRLFDEEAKTLGLTMQKSRVIACLHRNPDGLSQTAAAHAIDIDPMTLSGILDRLEKRDLIERGHDPSDSRAKLVTLTKKGEALYQRARAVGETIGHKLHNRALCQLDDARREILISGLQIIRDELSDMSLDRKD